MLYTNESDREREREREISEKVNGERWDGVRVTFRDKFQLIPLVLKTKTTVLSRYTNQ